LFPPLSNFPIHSFIYRPKVTNSHISIYEFSTPSYFVLYLFSSYHSINYPAKTDFLIQYHTTPNIPYPPISSRVSISINSCVLIPPILLTNFPIPTHSNQYLSRPSSARHTTASVTVVAWRQTRCRQAMH